MFNNICQDIFPNTPKPKTFQEIKLKEMFPNLPAATPMVKKEKEGDAATESHV